MDRNQMWETIDQVIKENLKENEAMNSWGSEDVQLVYWSISNNTLSECRSWLSISTLCLMTVPTLKIFIKELIDHMRENAERK